MSLERKFQKAFTFKKLDLKAREQNVINRSKNVVVRFKNNMFPYYYRNNDPIDNINTRELEVALTTNLNLTT